MNRTGRWSGRFATIVTDAFGVPDPECAIKVLADKLIADHAISGPPFDPQTCARRLGLDVVYANVEAAGVLDERHQAGRAKIVLPTAASARGSLGRQNFTIAHEIGHYAIRRHIWQGLPSAVLEDNDWEEERLCNVFAAEFLMPLDSLGKDLFSLLSSRHMLWPHDVYELRRQYQVSLQAMLSRIAWLFKGQFNAIIWADDFRILGPEWATPHRFRRAVVCQQGVSVIERVLLSGSSASGQVELLVDGWMENLDATAELLSDSSKILSLGSSVWSELRKCVNGPSGETGSPSCRTYFRSAPEFGAPVVPG